MLTFKSTSCTVSAELVKDFSDFCNFNWTCIPYFHYTFWILLNIYFLLIMEKSFIWLTHSLSSLNWESDQCFLCFCDYYHTNLGTKLGMLYLILSIHISTDKNRTYAIELIFSQFLKLKWDHLPIGSLKKQTNTYIKKLKNAIFDPTKFTKRSLSFCYNFLNKLVIL